MGRYIVEGMKILSRKRASRQTIALVVAVFQFAITLAPALHPLLHHHLLCVASNSETAIRESGTEYRSENHDTCFLCRKPRRHPTPGVSRSPARPRSEVSNRPSGRRFLKLLPQPTKPEPHHPAERSYLIHIEAVASTMPWRKPHASEGGMECMRYAGS